MHRDPTAAPAAPDERAGDGGPSRRRATVLFSDLKGSTALGERLDPESLREVLGRYFDEMRAVLEGHGGRVEKVVGDAIIAVFGLDGALDDHAGRAVEAADETRRVLATLNDRLERRWDVRLVNRTGVCTGEVLVGEAAGDRWIAGDAMDVAGRLEAAAPPLEVLLAEATRAEVAGRVEVAPEGDVFVSAVGSVPVYRLVAVTSPLPPWVAPAAPDQAAGAGRETRRTVTIVFADARPVAAAGAAPGPEALHEAMGRHFALARGILEQHGGIVESYMGDAVMAVFGIDRRREDDALRAVRAAWELRGIGPADDLGVRVEQRIGVNTGHLVAGDASLRQRMVTGDAVNVAARFEQAAAPGEVIIGRETAMLAGAAVESEALPPLDLKGKAEPVPRSGSPGSPPRRPPCAWTRRWWGAGPSSPRCAGRCATPWPPAPRGSRCSRATPGWARAGWPRPSPRRPPPTAPRCCAAGASRTARASRSGRSSRWSTRRRASAPTTPSPRSARGSARWRGTPAWRSGSRP